MAKRSRPKKPSHYTSSISPITSARATSATACTTKISPAGARSTSRATPTCCCGSRTHGRSSPPRRVNCARISANAQNARRCSPVRSEEHTSELQSRLHLVCRLLLEKKKKKKNKGTNTITKIKNNEKK